MIQTRAEDEVLDELVKKPVVRGILALANMKTGDGGGGEKLWTTEALAEQIIIRFPFPLDTESQILENLLSNMVQAVDSGSASEAVKVFDNVSIYCGKAVISCKVEYYTTEEPESRDTGYYDYGHFRLASCQCGGTDVVDTFNTISFNGLAGGYYWVYLQAYPADQQLTMKDGRSGYVSKSVGLELQTFLDTQRDENFLSKDYSNDAEDEAHARYWFSTYEATAAGYEKMT